MTANRRYQELASKWLDGSITEAEKKEFSVWYNAQVDEQVELPSWFATDEEELRIRIITRIRETSFHHRSEPMKRQRWLVAAVASLFLAISLGLYLNHNDQDKSVENLSIQKEVQPGGNRATLTLANGRVIDLSSEQSGIIIGEDLRYEDGTLVSDQAISAIDGGSAFMRIATPKGGQYQITLPDGSKVWLNSASSLTYPINFDGHTREVQLEGEAYFDVHRVSINPGVRPMSSSSGIEDTHIPFKVITRDQVVEVLGTQFNINAYSDEDGVKTTLVDGSVSVWSNVTKNSIDAYIAEEGRKKGAMMLKPGEQAVTTLVGVSVRKVDTEQFTAWKDGYFYFNGATIQDVIRQFRRWYDVDIQYASSNPKDADVFIGKIPKTVSLATAIYVLKGTGVQVDFREEQRLVIIKDPEVYAR